jgi:hypothetical protein
MSGQRSRDIDDARTVSLVEFSADVSVKLAIKWLDLFV